MEQQAKEKTGACSGASAKRASRHRRRSVDDG